jgi:hypothetical protein
LYRWRVDVQPLQESDTETKEKITKPESDDSSDDDEEEEEESAGKGKEAEPDHEETVDLTHLLKDGPKAQTHIMNNYFSIGIFFLPLLQLPRTIVP